LMTIMTPLHEETIFVAANEELGEIGTIQQLSAETSLIKFSFVWFNFLVIFTCCVFWAFFLLAVSTREKRRTIRYYHDTISSFCASSDSWENRFLLTFTLLISMNLLCMFTEEFNAHTGDQSDYIWLFLLKCSGAGSFPLVGMCYTKGKKIAKEAFERKLSSMQFEKEKKKKFEIELHLGSVRSVLSAIRKLQKAKSETEAAAAAPPPNVGGGGGVVHHNPNEDHPIKSNEVTIEEQKQEEAEEEKFGVDELIILRSPTEDYDHDAGERTPIQVDVPLHKPSMTDSPKKGPLSEVELETPRSARIHRTISDETVDMQLTDHEQETTITRQPHGSLTQPRKQSWVEHQRSKMSALSDVGFEIMATEQHNGLQQNNANDAAEVKHHDEHEDEEFDIEEEVMTKMTSLFAEANTDLDCGRCKIPITLSHAIHCVAALYFLFVLTFCNIYYVLLQWYNSRRTPVVYFLLLMAVFNFLSLFLFITVQGMIELRCNCCCKMKNLRTSSFVFESMAGVCVVSLAVLASMKRNDGIEWFA